MLDKICSLAHTLPRILSTHHNGWYDASIHRKGQTILVVADKYNVHGKQEYSWFQHFCKQNCFALSAYTFGRTEPVDVAVG